MKSRKGLPIHTTNRTLRNAEEYVQGVKTLLESNLSLDVFCMHNVFPYVLYPSKETDFLRVRKYETAKRLTLMGAGTLVARYHKAFVGAYERGVTFRYVMGISSVDYYRQVMHGCFGHESSAQLEQIASTLREANIGIHVVANAPGYCMFVGKHQCLFAIIDAKNPGTITSDSKAIQTHLRAFEQQYSCGEPFERWWEDIRLNRECLSVKRARLKNFHIADSVLIPDKREQPVDEPLSESRRPGEPGDNTVFISYSHKDKKFLDELLAHLKPLERAGRVSAWSDKQIQPGSQWLDDIHQALASSKVAVLLVTKDFLASDFIHEQEFGPILKEAATEGVTILWVLVRDCNWNKTPLKYLQSACSVEKPLAEMKAERDSAWVAICERIETAVT